MITVFFKTNAQFCKFRFDPVRLGVSSRSRTPDCPAPTWRYKTNSCFNFGYFLRVLRTKSDDDGLLNGMNHSVSSSWCKVNWRSGPGEFIISRIGSNRNLQMDSIFSQTPYRRGFSCFFQVRIIAETPPPPPPQSYRVMYCVASNKVHAIVAEENKGTFFAVRTFHLITRKWIRPVQNPTWCQQKIFLEKKLSRLLIHCTLYRDHGGFLLFLPVHS